MSEDQRLKFFQVDVFTASPFGGNPLVVFPWAGDLTSEQMQTVAREINFSETTFVGETSDDGYSVRIFTPGSELPFAGHPTIGTAWVLSELDLLRNPSPIQRSAAGETQLSRSGDVISFARNGHSDDDLQGPVLAEIAAAIGLESEDLGVTHQNHGVDARLQPARSDAGLPCLVVPVTDRDTLSRARPTQTLADDFEEPGAYVFTFDGPDVRARAFLPITGVPEDPATGSFAAGLGVYLRDRLGPLDVLVTQGVEMGRPSEIELRAWPEAVEIGGRTALVATGALETFPTPAAAAS